METKNLFQNQNKDLETLEYVLEDFLEIKTSLAGERMAALKQFLFSQPLNGHQVLSVEGFLLANQLVVVNEGNPHGIEHLVFLSPESGRIRVNHVGKRWKRCRRPATGHPATILL